MDIGDIMLLLVQILLFFCASFSIFSIFFSMKLVKKRGYKKALLFLGICEIVMLLVGILQLWVVLYPPFVTYTWNKVAEPKWLIMLIRYGYLIGVLCVMPLLTFIISLAGICNKRKNSLLLR